MTEEKKRTYLAETLGLPPLNMVLVNTESERPARPVTLPRSRSNRKNENNLEREEIVLRLIEHLIERP